MFSFKRIVAQSLRWLMLITIAIGKYLMLDIRLSRNSVCLPHKRETGEGFYPFTCFLT